MQMESNFFGWDSVFLPYRKPITNHIMTRLFYSLAIAAAFSVSVGLSAQTIKSQIVENGGTGPYKAVVVGDESLPAFTVYRPQDMGEAGKLPVILYANGGCANSTTEMRFLLNELASYGYIAVGIGPYDEDDPNEKWAGVLRTMGVTAKKMILSNGQEVKTLSAEERRKYDEQMRKEIEEAMKQQNKAKAPAPSERPFQTYPGQLLEAMDWLTAQNADPKSEYYHKIDLDKVVAMGQSCGGAQVLAVAHDPRIKTCVILNSGIGDMVMQGATQENLKNLHTPMLYLIGGPEDVAFPNAAKDYERIKELPVVMINTIDGHCGTYYERNGGAYAVVVHKWLDWQLKGQAGQSGIFLDDDCFRAVYPEWTEVRKNW